MDSEGEERSAYHPLSPTTTVGDFIVTVDAEIQEESEVQEKSEIQEKNDIEKKRAWLAKVASWGPNSSKTSPVITRVRKLEETPEGYPRLAAFQSSDNNFALYRSFSYLHSRVLLSHQYELARLEKELDELDQEDVEPRNGLRLKCQAWDKIAAEREHRERPRHEILADIHKKLLDYDDLLCKTRELISFQRPSSRDYKSVRTWFANVRPLVEDEENYIKCKEDILTLRHGRECAGFDVLIERMLQKVNCGLIRYIFCTPELRAKTDDKNIYYFSPSRIDALVGIIITAVIAVLLVLPVVALYQLTSNATRNATFSAIGVLMVFTLLFCAAMSLLTKARRHELFAASAAYCAVLVVFISNFSGLNGAVPLGRTT